MTNELACTVSNREELLMSCLYGELTPGERADFDRHLRSCNVCRDELDALSTMRGQLSSWAPPETAGRLAPDVVVSRAPGGVASALREAPLWARAAAAVFAVGLGAGAANLEMSRTEQGFSLRTGWRHPVPIASPVPDAAAQAQMTTLERKLQALDVKLQEAVTAGATTAEGDGALLRRVRALVEESERRQQRELALRVAEVARDLQTQRQIDLVKIDRSLGLIQSRTGMEVMRTQRQVNSLAQRVSQRP